MINATVPSEKVPLMTAEVDYWVTVGHERDLPGNANLAFDTIEGVQPLGNQFAEDVSKAVPDELYHMLFGQPELPDAEQSRSGGVDSAPRTLHTYAIIEGARVVNLSTMLEASGLEYDCLFNGGAYDEMKEVAPWIVRLEPDNVFTRNLFTASDAGWHLWRKNPGIYVRSSASLTEVRSHFRKFTKVQDEAGKWFYFRFWDPFVLTAYAAAISDKQDKVARWFGIHIAQIIVPLPERARVTVMSASHPASARSTGKFLLERDERAALQRARMDLFVDRLSDHCAVEVTACAALSSAQRSDTISHIVSLAQKSGFRSELAIANYTQASLLYGRPLEEDPQMAEIIRRPYQSEVEKSAVLLERVRA